MLLEKEMVNQNLKQEMKDAQYKNEKKEDEIRGEHESKLTEKEAEINQINQELETAAAHNEQLCYENKQLIRDIERLEKVADGMTSLNNDFQTLEHESKLEVQNLHSQYSDQIDNMQSIMDMQHESQTKLQSQLQNMQVSNNTLYQLTEK